jgi:hypothetical protein
VMNVLRGEFIHQLVEVHNGVNQNDKSGYAVRKRIDACQKFVTANTINPPISRLQSIPAF